MTVDVQLGDRVERGQILLTYESAEADTAVAEHEAALAAERQAQSQLSKAQQDLDRLRELYKRDAVAGRDVLAAEALERGRFDVLFLDLWLGAE